MTDEDECMMVSSILPLRILLTKSSFGPKIYYMEHTGHFMDMACIFMSRHQYKTDMTNIMAKMQTVRERQND